MISSNIGFPRIGTNRQLKKALEDYWAGQSTAEQLSATTVSLRKENWLLQKQLGLDHIPSNDFSLYDPVLDMTCAVGAIPSRYAALKEISEKDRYFTMARGLSQNKGKTIPAMEMTKWFDTNYHYIVPEFERGQRFQLTCTKPIDQFLEAKALGIQTRPVLLGPVSFLTLGKSKLSVFNRFSLLDSLLPAYEALLSRLADAGAEWVQMDEPALVMEIDSEMREKYRTTYARLNQVSPKLRLLIATYFGGLGDNLPLAIHLPISGLHLDLVSDPTQLEQTISEAPKSLVLSLGVIDGRNVWRSDLEKPFQTISRAVAALGPDRVMVAPSCSLVHVPVDLAMEDRMDPEVRSWLAFAKQKIEEVITVTRAVSEGRHTVEATFAAHTAAMEKKRTSPRVHNERVKQRLKNLNSYMSSRGNPYPVRKGLQTRALQLPAFPTTTIGSFPQTAEIRAARAEFKSGKRTLDNYEAFMQTEIKTVIRFQEEVGLDVLVHGEPERNDMVEYFGEQLQGFIFSQYGWVQSYGSRCVKPPIIFGDVSRPQPMTVKWARFAQSLTSKPVKGMLTGPVTILKWSFVRNDQPLADTCRQIALAIREEVSDLEAAEIRVIQIDEPAIREGLPLRRSEWKGYLTWAVESFRLATSGVRDETQIHTHMCYSEFNDMIEAIGAMDADVISIECSRSQMELLEAFNRYRYPNDMGPGVYDIHSPRIPTTEEITLLLRKAADVIPSSQLWVNPDCGLKTRRWEEVKPALIAMVTAARTLRK